MLIGRSSFAEFFLLILTKAFNAKVANFVHFKNLKRLEGSFVSERPVLLQNQLTPYFSARLYAYAYNLIRRAALLH